MQIQYRFKGGNILGFSEDATETLLKYRQTRRKNEAGGILLGRVFIPSGNVIIEVATTPNQFDKAGTYYFDRSREAAQRIVNKAWKKSKGEHIYLGEWHSHPEPYASPSARDRRMIHNMFHQTRMHAGILFLVVVGTEENWIGVEDGVWLERLIRCEDGKLDPRPARGVDNQD
jgi:integrative and conjugative element protein (TIGR02256 family)